MAFASRRHLLRVTEATARELTLWHEGVYMRDASGRTLKEMQHRAVADRLDLAATLARKARRLQQSHPPLHRDAISRGYYAMYHAWRAATYFLHGGDDFQEHKKLPTFELPGFPQVALWQNRLADARLTRNQADYEAYPKAESAWEQRATAIVGEAEQLVRIVRQYLRQRGCTYI